jgi:hypothetical protein
LSWRLTLRHKRANCAAIAFRTIDKWQFPVNELEKRRRARGQGSCRMTEGRRDAAVLARRIDDRPRRTALVAGAAFLII